MLQNKAVSERIVNIFNRSLLLAGGAAVVRSGLWVPFAEAARLRIAIDLETGEPTSKHLRE